MVESIGKIFFEYKKEIFLQKMETFNNKEWKLMLSTDEQRERERERAREKEKKRHNIALCSSEFHFLVRFHAFFGR